MLCVNYIPIKLEKIIESGDEYKGVHYSILYFWVYFKFPNKNFNFLKIKIVTL